jgi:hypothetical protein
MRWYKSILNRKSASRLRDIDAELAGLSFPLILPEILANEIPQIGGVHWAAQTAILEKFTSLNDFENMFETLSPSQQMGWINLLKGRAAEHLVAYDTGGIIHEAWNVPGHDITTLDGDFIQVKTGTVEYIKSTVDDIDDGFEVHTGIEGASVDGILAHDWSDESLEQALAHLDAIDIDILNYLESSLAVGSIFTGIEFMTSLKKGDVKVRHFPKYFILKTAKRTVRCAVVGISLSSGSPIIVTAGTAYVLFKARHLLFNLFKTSSKLIRFCQFDQVVKKTSSGVWNLMKHPYTKRTMGFGLRSTYKIAKATGKGIKWGWQRF